MLYFRDKCSETSLTISAVAPVLTGLQLITSAFILYLLSVNRKAIVFPNGYQKCYGFKNLCKQYIKYAFYYNLLFSSSIILRRSSTDIFDGVFFSSRLSDLLRISEISGELLFLGAADGAAD